LGNLEGHSKKSAYFEYPEYFAVLLMIPEKSVEIDTVSIITEKETNDYYKVALIKNSKKMLREKRYEEAAKMIFEAKKFSYVTKESLIDLYTCYFYVGETEQGKNVLSLINKNYRQELTLDDCIRIAEIAEECHYPAIANEWYQKADQIMSGSVSIDEFSDK